MNLFKRKNKKEKCANCGKILDGFYCSPFEGDLSGVKFCSDKCLERVVLLYNDIYV